MIDTQWNNMPHAAVLELKSRRNMLLFHRRVIITSAAAATPIPIITNEEIPAGYRVYLWGCTALVSDAVAWGTTATVKVRTITTQTELVNFAVAELTANQFTNAFDGSAVAASNPGTVTKKGEAADSGEGIEVVGNANGTGSDLYVVVFGCVAPPQLTTTQWGQGLASGGGDQLIR